MLNCRSALLHLQRSSPTPCWQAPQQPPSISPSVPVCPIPVAPENLADCVPIVECRRKIAPNLLHPNVKLGPRTPRSESSMGVQRLYLGRPVPAVPHQLDQASAWFSSRLASATRRGVIDRVSSSAPAGRSEARRRHGLASVAHADQRYDRPAQTLLSFCETPPPPAAAAHERGGAEQGSSSAGSLTRRGASGDRVTVFLSAPAPVTARPLDWKLRLAPPLIWRSSRRLTQKNRKLNSFPLDFTHGWSVSVPTSGSRRMHAGTTRRRTTASTTISNVVAADASALLRMLERSAADPNVPTYWASSPR